METITLTLKGITKPIIFNYDVKYEPFDEQIYEQLGRGEDFTISNITWDKGAFDNMDNELISDSLYEIEQQIETWCKESAQPDGADQD